MILLNAKPEELVKYSKGTYNKEAFIESVKDSWELTDKQIRMTFLISDLAEKANGVFSVSNEKFREMFEARFKLTISRSTVIRFFQLLEELGLLSVHEGRRKNRQQSANIFIIEPIAIKEVSDNCETPDETLDETPIETLDETQNIAFKNTLNKDFNKAFKKNIVNKVLATNQDTIDKLVLEYMSKGLSKQVCFMVVEEVQNQPDIKNFGGYLRSALENALYRSRFKKGLIDFSDRTTESNFYNWLETEEEEFNPSAILEGSIFENPVY